MIIEETFPLNEYVGKTITAKFNDDGGDIVGQLQELSVDAGGILYALVDTSGHAAAVFIESDMRKPIRTEVFPPADGFRYTIFL